MKSRRPPSIIESFNFAFEGIIHVLRTQRNMRIHFAIAFIVLVAALVVNVTKLELIALLISITFVLISEMLNSAVGVRVAWSCCRGSRALHLENVKFCSGSRPER